MNLNFVVENAMKPSAALAAHREDIRRVVASHRASNARVFGSVVHGNDTENSDLDILIDPTPETTLFDIGATSRWIWRSSGRRSTALCPSYINRWRISFVTFPMTTAIQR